MTSSFSQDDADLFRRHLLAIAQVEFFTIPVYLTAVYSFTDAATSHKDKTGQPLFDLQQKTLSVAVQEMYHLQGAFNLCNAFGVTPDLEQRNFPAGKITVPHLEPYDPRKHEDEPLVAELGNLPAVIKAMIEVEKPDPNHVFSAVG